jgi:uncharacterized delta-60 repeat protein
VKSRAYFRFLAYVLALACASLHAFPGSLDTTFSGDGKVSLSVTSGSDRANAMALQPDGKILLAGTCDGDGNVRFCLVRFDGDGSLDSGFGFFGGISGRITTGDDNARAVALAPDGKIVVAGDCFSSAQFDFCVARFLPNGAFDDSFSLNGKVVTDVTGGKSIATAVAVQSDGKVVVAGHCGPDNDRNFCVVRYTASGALDTTFSDNGKLATDIGRDDKVAAVAIQHDGKIVVVGTCTNVGSLSAPSFCIVRYTTTGQVDSGFPERLTGIDTLFQRTSEARSVAIQPDGKIVVGGTCVSETNGIEVRACLARVNVDGSTDLNFDPDMKSSSCVFGNAIALQVDGKIALAGTHVGFDEFCLALYNSDGSLDISFSGDGRVTTTVSGVSTAQSIAVQPDGYVVLSGLCSSANGPPFQFCAARFEGGARGFRECSLDVDGDGQITATVDSLIHARLALGITGSAVLNGITFPAAAKRNVWSGNGDNSVRKYLNLQCGMRLP